MKTLILTEKERRFLRGWCLELAALAAKENDEPHKSEGHLFALLAKKLRKKEFAVQPKLTTKGTP